MRVYYEKEKTVFMKDCDMFRRMKPSAVLAAFQDCSEDLTEGWGLGLDTMLNQGLLWVVAKAGFQVFRLPEHGEELYIRGWAGRTRTGIFPYHIDITSLAGNPRISGDTMWVLTDVEARTMLSPRIPSLTLPSPSSEKAPLPRMGFIKAPEDFRRTVRLAQYSEMDINGHLNNNRYLDWVCDLAEPAFHESHPMAGLRVNYHAEITVGEEVPLEWALSQERLWCRSPGRFEAEITF